MDSPLKFHFIPEYESYFPVEFINEHRDVSKYIKFLRKENRAIRGVRRHTKDEIITTPEEL